MADGPVVDTNVLLNLTTPVVDTRAIAPSGGDPLKTVLTAYGVHVPESVVGEVTDAARGNDLLSTAADAVLRASGYFTTHAVDSEESQVVTVGLDEGESNGVVLADELAAEMFVTDEFNSTNYLLIAQALENRNSLYTTLHLLCWLARHDALDHRYVDALLTYSVETKQCDRTYIEALRRRYLDI